MIAGKVIRQSLIANKLKFANGLFLKKMSSSAPLFPFNLIEAIPFQVTVF
jgi:hypothetical protein